MHKMATQEKFADIGKSKTYKYIEAVNRTEKDKKKLIHVKRNLEIMSEAERFKQKFPGHGAPRQSDFLRKRLQGKGGGKYFDSGDYNMTKTSHGGIDVPTGKAIPTPESVHRKVSSSKQSNLVEGTSPPEHGTPEERGMIESEEHRAKHPEPVIEEQ